MPSGIEHGEIQLPSVGAESPVARVDASVHPDSVCARRSRQQRHCQGAQNVAGGHGRAALSIKTLTANSCANFDGQREEVVAQHTLRRMEWGPLQSRDAQLRELLPPSQQLWWSATQAARGE